MVNLATLLNTSADDVKRPVALPDGTFYGVVKSHQFIESKQKKTPGVEYTVRLTHAHEDVDMSEYENTDDAKPLNERDMRVNFWLSEGALFMLTDFIESTGVDTAGRTLNELIPQAVGKPVVLDVTRRPTEQSDGFYNNVRSCKGIEA